MYALDRLRRENLAIQTAIQKRLMELNESHPYSITSALPTHLNPSFGASRPNLSHLSKSDVEYLLTQRSQNALHNEIRQNRQKRQLAFMQATGSTFPSGISATSKINVRNEVSAALCHPLFNTVNGMKTNTAITNSSRLMQVAGTINSNLLLGSHFGQNAYSEKQPVLGATITCSIPEDHSTREMKKARQVSFAPVRKKLNEADAKSSCKTQGDCSNKPNQVEKKPTKNFTKWQTMLESLKKFKESHGHCIVPRGYEDMKLASWVVEQRKQYRRYQENLPCGIDPNRIERLNEIGFTWDAQEAAWDRQLSHLREFHQIHGHCDVPRDDMQFPKLYLWIREQRRHYKLMKKGESSLLTKARLDALKNCGFSFDSLGAIFTRRLQALSEFRRLHGHCHVPPGYSENPKLYGWIHRMKKEYKLKMSGQRSTLRGAHISALNELEFPWQSGKTEYDSAMSSDGNEQDVASSDSDTASVSSSSSGSSLEVENASARPLKKRRLCK